MPAVRRTAGKTSRLIFIRGGWITINQYDSKGQPNPHTCPNSASPTTTSIIRSFARRTAGTSASFVASCSSFYLRSVFDYLTFGVLLLLLGADADLFRTGWFIESILSAVLVVFVLRTRLSIQQSRPARGLILASLLVASVAVILPYTPLAPLLGFKALDLPYLLAMIGIALLYFVVAEFAKRQFYRHVTAD